MKLTSLLALPLLSAGLLAQVPGQIEELGSLRYRRQLDRALENKDGKPLFVVFQEIPG